MKRVIKLLTAVLGCLVIVLSSSTVSLASDGYTYNYDYWGDIQYSPNAYEVVDVFSAANLELDKGLLQPSGMCIRDDFIYICDTGNNRIVELKRVNSTKIEVVRIIDSFQGNVDNNTFSGPKDVAVSEEGYIFVADTKNERIVKLDNELNYMMSFTKPVDATFDQSLNFSPSKIVIDTAGRVYCTATNVNKGLIRFEVDGQFSGFVGASKVTYSWADYVWKSIATQAQREQMESFVPTEYDNLYIDGEGFIYTCTSNVSAKNLEDGSADPIRKLNLKGDDILVQNGNFPVIGDIQYEDQGEFSGPSLITDVTAFDNGVYAGLDKNKCRLFMYDDQGNLLFAFGGNGNINGYFKSPVAVGHMGYDLLVLDESDSSLTLLTPTEYGQCIYDAIDQFDNGQYEESAASWQNVMRMNGNYDLAYIGIGRSLLRQGEYREAMDYFELKWDADNYSKAFKQYRKQWVEDHIGWIFLIAFVLLCVPLAIGKVKSVKEEIDTADIFIYRKKQD